MQLSLYIVVKRIHPNSFLCLCTCAIREPWFRSLFSWFYLYFPCIRMFSIFVLKLLFRLVNQHCLIWKYFKLFCLLHFFHFIINNNLLLGSSLSVPLSIVSQNVSADEYFSTRGSIWNVSRATMSFSSWKVIISVEWALERCTSKTTIY